MKLKKLLSVISAAALALSLAACSMPGLQKTDTDFYNAELDYEEAELGGEGVVNYAWSLKPTVQAENMIVFDGSQIDPDRSDLNDMYERVAIICQNGQYGFMDYKGNLLAQPKFKYYMLDPCGQVVLYNVTDEKHNVREYCTMDSDGHITTSYTPTTGTRVKYYYDVDNQKTYISRESDEWRVQAFSESKTVVAEKADVSEEFGRIEVVESDSAIKQYGLVADNKVILDFEYTGFYAPRFESAEKTAIALEKDGKWGYFNEKGEELIKFNCESVYSSYNGELSDAIDSGHPYLFSEDIVAVSINYSFGYYNHEGKCLVRSSEFSQARPVHHGKAWVCVDGMWGVIRFGDEEEEPEEVITVTSTALTTTTTTGWTQWQNYNTTTASEESTSSEESEWSDTPPAWTDTPTDTQPYWGDDSDTGWTDTEPVWTDTNPVWTDPPVIDDPTPPEIVE